MQQFNIFTQHRQKQADALDEIVRLLQECQASTRQLQRMVQPQAQPEQRTMSRIEQPQRQADKAGKK